MSEPVDFESRLIGLPAPPPVGLSALPVGTFMGATVLVTGGGTGLGKAIAAEFTRLGANIVVASRKREHLDAAVADLGSIAAQVSVANGVVGEAVAGLVRTPPTARLSDRGEVGSDTPTGPAGKQSPGNRSPGVLAVACDIRDSDQIAAVFDAAEQRFGTVDVLVNNAAANFPVPAEEMSPNAWRTVVDITLNGTFLMSREFARRHIAARVPGSIINVGASYAWTGGPGFAHSAAAKAGIKNMTETLAVEWGPYGIQVNGLVPGLMPHEDMTSDIQTNLQRTHDKDICQPALRVGQRQELGWAATFLASPYARFISGHTLVVDGANWQRRTLTNPPVVTVREQMNLGPFAP